MNVTNKILLNAAKCQAYSFYRFWIINRKPTGVILPHRLGLSRVSYMWSGNLVLVGSMNIHLLASKDQLPIKHLSIIQSYSLHCMFLPCHVRVSEWIHTLYLPEGQGTPCSKQARYLKFKFRVPLQSLIQFTPRDWEEISIPTFSRFHTKFIGRSFGFNE